MTSVTVPKSSQSLGIGAFADNEFLANVTCGAAKMKIGAYAFQNCKVLNNVEINASVIAAYAFYDCAKLSDVTIGKDVAVIGEFAFTGTNVSTFKVQSGGVITLDPVNSANLLKNNELILVAPKGATMDYETSAMAIAAGAFAGNTVIETVKALNVETLGDYAFAECANLKTVDMPNVKKVGNYAFAGTSLKAMPTSENLKTIGDYAFAGTLLETVTVLDGATVGKQAFASYWVEGDGYRYTAETLKTVVIGDDVVLGDGAFEAPVYMATYENTESLYYYAPYSYYLQDKDGNYVNENGEIVADAKDAVTYTYYRYDFSKAGAGIVPSVLNSVTIGENVDVGKYAFAGNAKLQSLVLGEGTKLADYAFMNSAFYDANVLKTVDLSGVVSIGEYAFSGSSLYDYQVIKTMSGTEDTPKEFIVNAYKLVYDYEKGEERITAYKTSNFAPIFEEADLSGAKEIGEGAFAYNEKLKKVTLSNELEAIPEYAFALCASLGDVALTESIKSIGKYAFYQTAVKGEDVDLRNVETIGEYAYANSKLTKVEFKTGAKIEDGAFKDCELLSDVDVSEVSYFGAEAFYNTALTKADLTSATYVGDFAFGESKVTEITFGKNIEELGENPFYGCKIYTYGTTEDVYFNGEKLDGLTQAVETYAINDKLQVIDGVLYQKVKAGLELISYPMLKEGKAYVVEEGTTRISARAFAGSKLEDTTLPSTLKALGDKAFYECENLSVIVFKSYEAPILEEDYDGDRISYDCLAMTGRLGEYVGLGIVKYYMWNATSQYTNFYFGANFVDFIGDMNKHIVMVKPANGRNYKTFIFEQYFKTVVEGSNALMQETIRVISLINAIPSEITLSEEAVIMAAREAYDKIMTLEQKALVSNYSTLTNAESTLEYLKLRNEQPSQPETPVDPGEQEEPKKDGTVGFVVTIVILSAVVVGLGALSAFALVRGGFITFDKFAGKKKGAKQTEENANEKETEENSTEE
jgi:acetyltransferase-like isoleucine patch superfamily enzyme